MMRVSRSYQLLKFQRRWVKIKTKGKVDDALSGKYQKPEHISSRRPGYLGVTPPISTNESNEREKEVTESLIGELRRQNTIESEEETIIR